jgi:anti-sigma-K factor RskA
MSDELNALAGAYALDALDGDERALFEQHLLSCDDCAAEVRGMQAAAAELSHATAVAPPPELRGSVLTAISQVRPLPPVVDNVVALHRARAGRSRWQLLAAACALIAIASSVWGYQQHRDAARKNTASITLVEQLLNAPDLASTTGPVGSGQATLMYSKSQGKLIMVGHGIPAVAAGKTYQLWLISANGTATSAALFAPDGNGNIRVTASGDLNGTARMGVSLEPTGGSAKPTLPVVAAMNI